MDAPYVLPLEADAMTYNICLAGLLELYLWAPKTSGITHWRTSYRFPSQVDGMIGMSVDMYQPVSHQFNTGEFGSLKLMTTPNKSTSTRRDPAVSFAIALKMKVKVQHLVDLITSERHHYCTFHQDGSGACFGSYRYCGDSRNMDG